MGAKEPPRLEGCIQRGGEVQPDVFEASGTVKGFDPSKGYGFMTPDEGLARRSPACDLLATRRLPDRLRRRTRYLRSHEE